MRGNREEKQALDRQTAYLTFLPPMDEGFHTGYHTAPGIVSDHNQRPREWLESLARCLENARHAPALEETYWGLVGGDAAAEESELLLTGQLLDAAQVRLLEDSVELQLFKKYE